MKKITLLFFCAFNFYLQGFEQPVTTWPVDEKVDYIFNLLDLAREQGYLGEDISQLEHALQAAAYAQFLRPNDIEFIVAALLHDIGHLLPRGDNQMGPFGKKDHEIIGANFLRECGFSERVAQLVQAHVDAKRYLRYKNQKYALSHGSEQSLIAQGGPMSEQEAETFEAADFFEDKIAIRRCEEHAKEKDKEVADLSAYRNMVLELLDKSA